MSHVITAATATSVTYVLGVPERDYEPIGPNNKPAPVEHTILVDNASGDLAVGDHIEIIVRKVPKP